MKKLILVALILIAVVAGIFIFGNSSISGNAVKEDGAKEFRVEAFRFGYSPDLIEVNKGDRVRIIIENTDVLHGIRIPELGIKGNEEIEFTADKTGEFVWYCTNMCGEGHREMQGKLIVR